MTKREVVNKILLAKIVAILRLKPSQTIMEAISALIEGGINVLEITSNTPKYAQYIKQARVKYQGSIIGAGTILTIEQAEIAIEAGAQFLVTPNTNLEIIKVADSKQIPVIMGAFTPTEVALAQQAGADIVKLFPAIIGGISYLKAIKGPLDKVKIFAVGGIGLENLEEWLIAGVDGVGMGSNLIATTVNDSVDIDQTRKNASLAINILQSLSI